MLDQPQSLLLFRVRDTLCALPLAHVEETMRPLPVEPIAGVPSFVRGVAVVRGAPIPVVDAASLIRGEESAPTRFVTIKTGARRVALAVDAVVGIVAVSQASVDSLPPLLDQADGDAIAAIGTLDKELLLVLRHTRLLPDHLWATLPIVGTTT